MYVESAVVVVVLFSRLRRPENPKPLRRLDTVRALPNIVVQLPESLAAYTASEAKDALNSCMLCSAHARHRRISRGPRSSLYNLQHVRAGHTNFIILLR